MENRASLICVALVICCIQNMLLAVSTVRINSTKTTVYFDVEGYIDDALPGRQVGYYLGIPYAKPPVGDLRFEFPVQPDKDNATKIKADTLPPMCIQEVYHDDNEFVEDFSYVQLHRPGFNTSSEDCLYLNVYVPNPETSSSDLLPVLVFVHGGSNVVGMGAMFDGDIFATLGDVVVVTFNYRLGALGFLGTTEDNFPGNYALWDQRLAFMWVQENIRSFRGNNSRVTIMGHSAGSFDVGLHLVSQQSRGLFERIICQSGAPLTHLAATTPRSDKQETVRGIAHTLGCQRDALPEVKACLKGEKITAMQLMRKFETNDHYPYPGLIGDSFLPESVEDLLKRNEINTDSYMLGVVSKEMGVLGEYEEYTWADAYLSVVKEKHIREDVNISEILQFEYSDLTIVDDVQREKDALSVFYGDMVFSMPTVETAKMVSKETNTSVIFYVFDYRGDLFRMSENAGVTHGLDLFYLFGAPFKNHPEFDEKDQNFSKYIIERWAHFVKTGNPVDDKLLSEVLHDPENRRYLRFHADDGTPTYTMQQHYRRHQELYWNTYMPHLIKRIEAVTEHTDNTPADDEDDEFPESDDVYRTLFYIFVGICGFLFLILIISCIVFIRMNGRQGKGKLSK